MAPTPSGSRRRFFAPDKCACDGRVIAVLRLPAQAEATATCTHPHPSLVQGMLADQGSGCLRKKEDLESGFPQRELPSGQ